MNIPRVVNLSIIICICMGLIFLGGALFYSHDSDDPEQKNPMLWALGISISSTGSLILIGILLKGLLPNVVYKQMRDMDGQILL